MIDIQHSDNITTLDYNGEIEKIAVELGVSIGCLYFDLESKRDIKVAEQFKKMMIFLMHPDSLVWTRDITNTKKGADHDKV